MPIGQDDAFRQDETPIGRDDDFGRDDAFRWEDAFGQVICNEFTHDGFFLT